MTTHKDEYPACPCRDEPSNNTTTMTTVEALEIILKLAKKNVLIFPYSSDCNALMKIRAKQLKAVEIVKEHLAVITKSSPPPSTR